MADEISGGQGSPRLARTVVFVLVAGLVGVAGVLASGRGADEPAAPPPRAVTPVPARSPAASVPPTPVLAVGALCPVRTDGRSTLEVSFELHSRADEPVALVSVDPDLPLGGLRPRGWDLRDGGCGVTGRRLAGGLVPPPGPVVVTLRFGLPARCPWPYPVLVVIRERHAGTVVLSTRYTLLADLGGISFDTCPD